MREKADASAGGECGWDAGDRCSADQLTVTALWPLQPNCDGRDGGGRQEWQMRRRWTRQKVSDGLRRGCALSVAEICFLGSWQPAGKWHTATSSKAAVLLVVEVYENVHTCVQEYNRYHEVWTVEDSYMLTTYSAARPSSPKQSLLHPPGSWLASSR